MKEDDLKKRKNEHLALCETNDVAFRKKSSGFEHYDFDHLAITEVNRDAISLQKYFFSTLVELPFVISCMTGGTTEADSVNLRLAEVAKAVMIPMGLGSVRYALEDTSHDRLLQSIRNAAGGAPLLPNIGGAQIIQYRKDFSPFQRVLDLTGAACFVVHLNPVQEALQKNGDTDFTGLLQALEQFVSTIRVPVVVKEVGAGISARAARRLLEAGVAGIDVAGAGGTSWSGVEILRNEDNRGSELWDWGLPTAYCLRTVHELHTQFQFMLIGSGGVHTGLDAAKALALGADFAASARVFLQVLMKSGPEAVIGLIHEWAEVLRTVMFATGCTGYSGFDKNVLVVRKDLF
ncbi:MAG: type 2 isopentenyl-diphosphate Delta-isomerase [Ignavibacteria bacterium]|nr:type 2 isopentenyl-diphosphate Delta-isomerase [Ignavibacteria bacterium]